MPNAVWQGFCNLLKPPPVDAPTCMHRPLSRGSLGGHDASVAHSKTPKMPKMASNTDLGGHQSRQDGTKCLQDGPRKPQDGLRTAQEASETSQKTPKVPSGQNK